MTLPVSINPTAPPYNAFGDGITDDTSALQACINAAVVTGAVVELPAACFKTSAPLIVSDSITIRGAGYQDVAGSGYNVEGAYFYPVPSPENLRGTVFLPGATDTFQITSARAVHFRDFQISYNQNIQSGLSLAGIRVTAAAGAFNTRSTFKDLSVTCADQALVLTNALEFRVDNVNALFNWQNGIVTSAPDAPSAGDSYIANSTFWGQNVPAQVAAIQVTSSGGLRIVNNKINFGSGTGSSGIVVNPNLVIPQSVEPIVIVGNSIEGPAIGINIANANTANGIISEMVVSGNQIWSAYNAFRVNANGTNRWFGGLTLTGNVLMIVGGANKSVVVLDNLASAIISGNHFDFSGGGSGWGTALGPHATNINIQSNSYPVGMAPCYNAGTGNTIGGGSA